MPNDFPKLTPYFKPISLSCLFSISTILIFHQSPCPTRLILPDPHPHTSHIVLRFTIQLTPFFTKPLHAPLHAYFFNSEDSSSKFSAPSFPFGFPVEPREELTPSHPESSPDWFLLTRFSLSYWFSVQFPYFFLPRLQVPFSFSLPPTPHSLAFHNLLKFLPPLSICKAIPTCSYTPCSNSLPLQAHISPMLKSSSFYVSTLRRWWGQNRKIPSFQLTYQPTSLQEVSVPT